MEEKSQTILLKTLFFRPDAITVIKAFLPNSIHSNVLPRFYKKPQFLKYLRKNEIKIDENVNEAEREENKTNEQTNQMKRIVEEDNLELLLKETEETEENRKMILENSFFEVERMKIPVLHYCALKGAMKCFKFLLLHEADPSKTLSHGWDKWRHQYGWDCMGVAVCFGEWEMMKILEEKGLNKLNNPSWKENEAASAFERSQIKQLFLLGLK